MLKEEIRTAQARADYVQGQALQNGYRWAVFDMRSRRAQFMLSKENADRLGRMFRPGITPVLEGRF